MAVNDFSEEASTPSTPTTGRWKLYPKSTGWFFLDDAGVETPLASTSVSSSPPVRQTCELGPVDTSGFAAFGGSTGSTTVTTSGTLKVTAANGISDYRGSITNPSWTSLSTNGTMYLYLDIAADGTCTTGSTTLAPTYRWGGADVVTSGQFTFNIQEMVGKVGNGATAVQTYRVFVGEVTVAGNVTTAIVWYALMGRYDSGYTATLPSANSTTVKNHNLGTNGAVLAAYCECTTADQGFAVGVVMLMPDTGQSGNFFIHPFTSTSKVMTFYTGANYYTLDAGTYAAAGLIRASWKYKFTAQRGW